MHARWDLLSRPDGMSVRRLRRCFTRMHGRPSSQWLADLQLNDGSCFEIFVPHRRSLRPASTSAIGRIFVCVQPVPLVRRIECASGALANPWPITESQSASVVCDAFEALLRMGGCAEDLPGAPAVALPHMLGRAAAEGRVAALIDAADYVAQGGDIHLLLGSSCAERRRADPMARCHVEHISDELQRRAVQVRERRTSRRPPATLAVST